MPVRRIVLLVLAALGLVALAVGFVVSGRSPEGTLVIHGKRAAAAIALTLSNSASKPLVASYRAPQVCSHGKWTTWRGSPYTTEDFWLLPGGSTNITVVLPETIEEVRIPFEWGYLKGSGMQKIAPRLHTRLWNLRNTLRHSQSFAGWRDPYGYLPDEYRFYYLTNSEPGSAARSQSVRPETNQTSTGTGSTSSR